MVQAEVLNLTNNAPNQTRLTRCFCRKAFTHPMAQLLLAREAVPDEDLNAWFDRRGCDITAKTENQWRKRVEVEPTLGSRLEFVPGIRYA
jgi:hypothetical protein